MSSQGGGAFECFYVAPLDAARVDLRRAGVRPGDVMRLTRTAGDDAAAPAIERLSNIGSRAKHRLSRHRRSQVVGGGS